MRVGNRRSRDAGQAFQPGSNAETCVPSGKKPNTLASRLAVACWLSFRRDRSRPQRSQPRKPDLLRGRDRGKVLAPRGLEVAEPRVGVVLVEGESVAVVKKVLDVRHRDREAQPFAEL